jgi:mannose-6-phosphate isomerase-like protein (cupin superfamily)
MAGIEVKTFDSPDETRPFEGKGHLDMVTVGGRDVGRGTFEPGWRWSENVKPIAQTESCRFHHVGYVLSGRMRVTMDDGSEGEVGPGDVLSIAPGHDAEVIGDEPCVMIDVGEDEGEYAKRT